MWCSTGSSIHVTFPLLLYPSVAMAGSEKSQVSQRKSLLQRTVRREGREVRISVTIDSEMNGSALGSAEGKSGPS